MLQDNRGCRRMLLEWSLGMFVLAASIGALIGLALRSAAPPGGDPGPAPAAEAVVRDGVAERTGAVSDLIEVEER